MTLNYSEEKTGLITGKNSLSYRYDAIGRLLQAGAESFSYDKADNNLNHHAVYNTLNNHLKTSDLYTLTYDAMGNLKSKVDKLTHITSTYTFNARNQLTEYQQLDENN